MSETNNNETKENTVNNEATSPELSSNGHQDQTQNDLNHQNNAIENGSPQNTMPTNFYYFIPPQSIGYTSPQPNEIGSPQWSGEPIHSHYMNPYFNHYKQSPQLFNYSNFQPYVPYEYAQNWPTQIPPVNPNHVHYPTNNYSKNQTNNNSQSKQQFYMYENYQTDEKARSNTNEHNSSNLGVDINSGNSGKFNSRKYQVNNSNKQNNYKSNEIKNESAANNSESKRATKYSNKGKEQKRSDIINESEAKSNDNNQKSTKNDLVEKNSDSTTNTQSNESAIRTKYIYKNHGYHNNYFEDYTRYYIPPYTDSNYITSNNLNLLASEVANLNFYQNRLKNFTNYTYTLNNYQNNFSTLSHKSPYLDKYNPQDFFFNGEKEGARESRFFVIKSYSKEDVVHSIKHGIWCSTESGNQKLNQAFNETLNKKHMSVYLLFSVNSSGQFCGLAEMTSKVDFEAKSNVWAQDKWKGKFEVKWIFVKDVPNTKLRHITLPNNENKAVTNSRDTQEIPFDQAVEVLNVFRNYNHKYTILDDVDYFFNDRVDQTNSSKVHSYKQQKLNNNSNGDSTKPDPQVIRRILSKSSAENPTENGKPEANGCLEKK